MSHTRAHLPRVTMDTPDLTCLVYFTLSSKEKAVEAETALKAVISSVKHRKKQKVLPKH